jgi:hypothetical protein
MYEPGHNYYKRLQRSGNVLVLKSDLGKAKTCAVPLPLPPLYTAKAGFETKKEWGASSVPGKLSLFQGCQRLLGTLRR